MIHFYSHSIHNLWKITNVSKRSLKNILFLISYNNDFGFNENGFMSFDKS